VRLWTLHPKYLDGRGLVALWREALLAQAVLGGHTRGYTRHPQLIRFSNSPSPMGSIAAYLQAVHAEACRRAYRFDETKINAIGCSESIVVTRGQIDFEWDHLKAKLQRRDPSWLAGLKPRSRVEPHPLFRIVPGAIEKWEIT
jgi:hypothetical protein